MSAPPSNRQEFRLDEGGRIDRERVFGFSFNDERYQGHAGDTLASANHAELAAVMLQPFVSAENHWIVKHHAVFQGYYFFHHLDLDRDMRDSYRDHPLFRECAAFCQKYDQNSFDPEYDTLPLQAFEPALRKVFAVPRKSIYVPEEGA